MDLAAETGSLMPPKYDCRSSTHTLQEATLAAMELPDLCVGTIIKSEPFEGARSAAYVLQIDFGPRGVLKSTAQLTGLYKADELLGRQVVAHLGLPPRQVGPHRSRCLVLGAVPATGADPARTEVVLLQPDRAVANGTPIA